jgi:hypothetical protein
MTHDQDFENGSRIYSYLDFPAHRDLYGMFSLNRPLKDLNLGMNLYGSKYSGQSATVNTDLFLQTNFKPLIPKAINYSVGAKASYSRQPVSVTDGETAAIAMDSTIGSGLQMQLSSVPVKLGFGTSLSSSLSFGQDWGGWYAGSSIRGTVSLSRRFSDSGNLGLVYSYSKSPGVTTGSSNRQRLSGNLYINPGRWRASLFSTYGLDDSSISSFGEISYAVGGGWRLCALGNYQKYNSTIASQDGTVQQSRTLDFSDFEFAIGKQIMGQEAMLVWSKSKKRFRVELGAIKF